MARALIVGCGCRGRLLGERLLERGLGGARDEPRARSGLAAIEAAGIEPALADPSAPGHDPRAGRRRRRRPLAARLGEREAGAVAAIHGPRLERLLESLVDTPVRGFVYEAAARSTPILERGAAAVRAAARDLADPGRGRRGRATAGWAAAMLDDRRC